MTMVEEIEIANETAGMISEGRGDEAVPEVLIDGTVIEMPTGGEIVL